MMRHPIFFFTLVWIALGGSSSFARHMEGRTGFGITLHDFHQTPCISMRYHMSNFQSAVVLAGFDTVDDARRSMVIGGKFYQNAHIEENLTFYVGLGGFIISDKMSDPTSSTGLQISGVFGGEFFFSGLSNLGFQFETGVAMRTVRSLSFATLGSGFFGGAIHYYF